MDNDDNVMSEGIKRLEKLYKKFEAYCKELVVFGFNSAGMILNSSRSICLKNCVNMISNQPSLLRNPESIPVSRLNT